MPEDAINQAAQVAREGGLVAYPTEAVYGLGCNPLNTDAVERLLALKGRPQDKGLILIAADVEQLMPFIKPPGEATWQQLHDSWPGPVTWVVDAADSTPAVLTGPDHSIAVRVTDHGLAADLCRAFGGALVSTSANPSGVAPARSAEDVRSMFGEQVDFILEGSVGNRSKPTEIRDARSGEILRPGD